MHHFHIPVWKTAPFFRLLLPLIIGIVSQWYIQATVQWILVFLALSLAAFFLFYFLPLSIRFRWQSLQGLLMSAIIIGFGAIISWNKDIRHHHDWYGHNYDSSSLVLIISEPLTEKLKSFKARALVESVMDDSTGIFAKGVIIVYFAKSSGTEALAYGDKILISKPLQRIKNSGNPAAFNYERYAAFQQTFHTVFLNENDWVLLKEKTENPLRKLIFSMQADVLSILRKNVHGDKNVLGIAEALLIGYKEDLDKDLVQAYSNAGVVHIIAISGLHLGLIYVMLVWIFNRLPVIKKAKLAKVIMILSCLWLFSLLTGASASVLRSAVMFTCIVVGKNFFTQSSIYNSLAASAFILLCYDPFLLWDVGFQLSYLAVIGIVWLQRPIINLLYFKNTWVNQIWSMFAITLAAQAITFPICVYYFHQFPTYFFLTNLLAVPLSTIILFAEIFLIVFSWIPVMGLIIGKIAGFLIWLMNILITSCNRIPYSLVDNIYADLITTCVLYVLVISICAWLMNKRRIYLQIAMTGLLCFIALHSFAKLQVQRQRKIIIYNVPQHQAIDFIWKDKYRFLGDSGLIRDGSLKSFHLKPARISFQCVNRADALPGLSVVKMESRFHNTRMIIIDSAIAFMPVEEKLKTDILLISKNPRISITGLVAAIRPSIIIFDASNSMWKIERWKKECLALALPCFSIPHEGAYIFDIE